MNGQTLLPFLGPLRLDQWSLWLAGVVENALKLSIDLNLTLGAFTYIKILMKNIVMDLIILHRQPVHVREKGLTTGTNVRVFYAAGA